MQEQAIALAKSVNYHSAGTVEFIVDQEGNFYFLEMNTRLQVEHRVTELVTGIDLVEQMILIAAGEKLQLRQEDITLSGWAFESRIYAEDPKRGFLPSTGRITRYQEPTGNKLVLDSGVYEGGEVSMFYDPMIAKVCTHAQNREKAIDAMQNALAAYVIQGVTTNMGFLQAVLGHERFRRGDISTNFIEQEYPEGFAGAELTSENSRIFVGAGVYLYMRSVERSAQIDGQIPGRQRAIGSRWVVALEGKQYPVYVRPRDYGYDITIDDETIVVRSSYQPGGPLFQGSVNGKPVAVHLRYRSDGFKLIYAGAEATVAIYTPRVAELVTYMPERVDTQKEHELLAPIAGLIVSVAVEDGEKVKAGQELLVIEAMKMENVIHAARDAVVKQVLIAPSESVQADQVLIEFIP
jgi:propionyl-CoA carboxylase alpha chain